MCYFVFCVWKGAFSHNHEIEISFNEKGYMDKKKRFVASCSYTACGCTCTSNPDLSRV